MKLVSQLVEGDYTTNTYDDGTTETFLTEFPPKPMIPPILTEQQEVAMETMVNTEMLLALTELGGM